MIYKYDGQGQKCPVPLIQLRQLLKKMQSGDECHIIINDIGSLNDIPKLLNKKGYTYQQKDIAVGIVEINIKL
ncbi:sulfurtransferase TusA family protein [Colwellia sp. E2M01]|uniref:sulfurtransferase TusA family protein n=1 Tax=Colwellia sp. E2M01 TaxID=2841561 RepID=UPI001C088539|nr:sulfurtransferase TusA family protein [Colwellia sp. E2M01]MBU2871282.1 sulfurtransferase TusA family protein [Colwellia sp. E2M01]